MWLSCGICTEMDPKNQVITQKSQDLEKLCLLWDPKMMFDKATRGEMWGFPMIWDPVASMP